VRAQTFLKPQRHGVVESIVESFAEFPEAGRLWRNRYHLSIRPICKQQLLLVAEGKPVCSHHPSAGVGGVARHAFRNQGELMAELTLDFAHNAGQIQLEKTVFRLSSGLDFISARGKTPGAYRCNGAFQWTPAVKAVCVLFLQALSGSIGTTDSTAPMISGRRGSLATSLDYAIDKEPQWLCDMFGLDESGKTNLRRLIFRSNPGGKRPGLVSISLNELALPTENIKVLVNSVPLTDQGFLERMIAQLSNEQPDSITTQTGLNHMVIEQSQHRLLSEASLSLAV